MGHSQSKENNDPSMSAVAVLPDVASILHVRHSMPARNREADISAETENVFDALHKVGGDRLTSGASAALNTSMPMGVSHSTSRTAFSPNRPRGASLNTSASTMMNTSVRST